MLTDSNTKSADFRYNSCKRLSDKVSSKFQSTGYGNTRLIPRTSSGDVAELFPTRTDVPLGLTPCDSVRVGIDYFRFLTIRGQFVTPDEFRRIYQYLFPESEPISQHYSEEPRFAVGKGLKKYCTYITTLHGCRLYFTELENEDNHVCVEFLVDLSGEYLSRFSLSELLEINSFFRQFGSVKCSRFDISIDVPRVYQLDVVDLQTAYSNGNYAGFRKAHINSKLDGKDSTVYLGSRETTHFIRIYDMAVKHCMDAQRYEVEYKRKLANAYSYYFYCQFSDRGSYAIFQSERTGQDWLNCRESTEQYELRISRELAGIALGCVSFIDRSDSNHHTKIDELPKLPFWDKFLSAINQGIAIKPIRIPVVPKTIEKTLDWLARQVSKTLLVLKQGLGTLNFKTYLEALLSYSEDRVTQKDKAIIDLLRQQYATA